MNRRGFLDSPGFSVWCLLLELIWPRTSGTDSVFILSLFSPWLKELSYLTVRQLRLFRVDLDPDPGTWSLFSLFTFPACFHTEWPFSAQLEEGGQRSCHFCGQNHDRISLICELGTSLRPESGPLDSSW